MALRNLYQDRTGDSFERMRQRQMRQFDPMTLGPLPENEAEKWKIWAAAKGLGLSALSGVGSVLDTPGSMVRDLAGMGTDLYEGKSLGQAWKANNPVNQLAPSNLLTFGGRENATGRELLERWGVAPPNVDRGWIPDAGDLAGFGLEVGMDPLTYLIPGAGKAVTNLGKAASKANLLKTATKLAKREEAIRRVMGPGKAVDLLRQATRENLDKIGKIERGIGKREARAYTQSRHILEPDLDLLDQAKGLEPLSNPVARQELLEAQGDLAKLKGINPGEILPNEAMQHAVASRLSNSMTGKKWSALLDNQGLPREEAIKKLGEQLPGNIYKHFSFVGTGTGPSVKATKPYLMYARAMDSLGKAAFDNSVARVIKSGFQPSMWGVTSRSGRAMAQGAQDGARAVEPHVRKFTQEMQQHFDKLAEVNPIYADENLRSLLTGWSELHTGQRTPQQAMDFIEQLHKWDDEYTARAASMGNDITPFSQDFGSTWDVTEAGVTGAGRPTGGGTITLLDKDGNEITKTFRNIDPNIMELYGPRQYRVPESRVKSQGYSKATREWYQQHDHNKSRWGALVGIGGGDETIRQMAVDAATEVQGILDNLGPTGKITKDEANRLARYLESKWGPAGARLIKDEYLSVQHDFVRTRTGAMMRKQRTLKMEPKEKGRFQELANWLLEYSPDELRTGLYLNSPMADWENLMLRISESNEASNAMLRAVAAHAQPANTPGEKIKDVLQKLNLRTAREKIEDAAGDITEQRGGALDFLEDIMHPSIKGDATYKAIGDMVIPPELARDMLNFNDISRTSKGFDKMIDMIDNVTNLFKFHATIPFAAFHTRNLYGGQFQNLANGMWSPWSFGDARRLQNGELGGKKLLEIPLVKQRLERKGLAVNQKHATEEALSIIAEHGVYSDKAFHADVVDTIRKNPESGVRRVSTLGRQPVELLKKQTYLDADPVKFPPGEGWSKFATPESLSTRAGRVAENLNRAVRGDPTGPKGALGFAQRDRGISPHPFAAIPGAEDIGLSQPYQYAKTRRLVNPKDWTFTQVRGVGSHANTNWTHGQVMENASHWIEGVNRVAPFLHLLHQGVDPAEAMKRVMAAQVDYSARNYGQFENTVLRRVFPFYKWQSRMLPHVMQTLMHRPGGIQAQAMRASTLNERDTQGAQWTPKRVRDMGLAIPLGEQTPEGRQRYLGGIDLPHEGALQPFRFGGNTAQTLNEMFRSLGGNMNPLMRVPLESLTGKQLYTGRNLGDVHGGVTTLYRNALEHLGVKEPWQAKEENLPVPGLDPSTVGLAENALMGVLGRLVSTVRPLTEPPSRIKDDASFWTKALTNTLSGVKLSDYNIPEEQARELRPAIDSILDRDPLVKPFSRPYVPREYRPQLQPQTRAMLRLRATIDKERQETSQQRQSQEILEGNLPPWAVRSR